MGVDAHTTFTGKNTTLLYCTAFIPVVFSMALPALISGLGRRTSQRVCGIFSEKVFFIREKHQEVNGKVNMGVEIDTIQPGDGRTFPKTGQTVVVHYTGTFTDGKKFDSSRDRGTPFKFKIGMGQVIKGWDEGVAQLSVGQRAKLTCSPDYAYGAKGHPGVIPPNSVLLFDVELIKVE